METNSPDPIPLPIEESARLLEDLRVHLALGQPGLKGRSVGVNLRATKNTVDMNITATSSLILR